MALEKINYEVAPEDLVIEETQEQLKSTQEQIMDGLSLEQKAKATPSAIVQDREAQQQNLAVEWLSDPEKLKKIQTYFKDMNNLLGTVHPDDATISADGYKLSLKSTRWDAGYSTEATLRKWGKEVFIFDLSSDMFHKERWNDYKVNGVLTVWKNSLFFHGDDLSDNRDDKYYHGIYSNYDVLNSAQSYTSIVKKMVSDYNTKRTSARK